MLFIVTIRPSHSRECISIDATEKIFVTEQEQIIDCFRLGEQIYASGFRPTFIVGLWRGGSSVGLVVQECLATLGVETDHIALRTSYQGRVQYEQVAAEKSPIRVHGKQYLLENLNADDRLLIVDDVFSSGRHTRAVVDQLGQGLKRNMPSDIRIAALWYRTQTVVDPDKPDFYLTETDKWLVLPYEFSGLTKSEIAQHKPYLVPLLSQRS